MTTHHAALTALEQRIAQNAPTKRGLPVLKIVKITAMNIVVGMLCGGWLVHELEAKPLRNMIVRGYCGQEDPSPWKTLFFYRCIDAAIALQLQASDIETDRVLSEMAASPPPTPKRKAR